jgi:serine/threonine-protein kinase
MRHEPPDNLVRLLERLELATPQQVAAVASRAARPPELAEFESAWLDALVQARTLAPFQAAEIAAGRGESLRCGPYVVLRPQLRAHYAECYAARHVESRRAVQLYVIRRPQRSTPEIVAALAKLVADSAPLCAPGSPLIEDFGTSGPLVWAASADAEGVTAADWMVENGRLPAPAVLHVAREMARELAAFEQSGIVHGDLCAAGLLLQDSGRVVLGAPGLRGIVRPHEGYSFGDLRPEAYDYLAPERIADGTPPTTACDVYACGCLWWHLLTGRAPFAGGNSLEKLKAVHAARLVDVRQLAPDVPDDLAAAVRTCLAREIDQRPPSFAILCELLGTPTRSGAAALSAALWRPGGTWHVVRRSGRGRKPSRRPAPWPAAIAAGVLLILAALSPWWLFAGRAQRPQTASQKLKPAPSVAKRPPAEPAVAATPRPRVDPDVKPAAAALPPADKPAEDVLLAAGEVLHIEQLDLKPHTRVRGKGGRRPRVSVPRRGLTIACEDVTFDGIDFAWDVDRSERRAADVHPAAMIVVRAQIATFVGCSFQCGADARPAAIAWTGAAESLPGLGGEIALADCALAGTDAVVDCPATGPLSVSLTNVLCVDSGPIVRLHRSPRSGEPLLVALDHVTTRGETAVLECRYGRLGDDVGPITITAQDSALAGTPAGGLVIFAGAERPERLARALTWTGAGSIVTPQTAMLVWRGAGRARQAWAEDDLDIAGLVRSELEFAGAAGGPPSDSRVVRWQVPLRSADPPGANPQSLAPRAPLRRSSH